MRLGMIDLDSAPRLVLVVGDWAVPVDAATTALGLGAPGDVPTDVAAVVRAGVDTWEFLEALSEQLERDDVATQGWAMPLAEARFLAPLLPPKNAWAVAGNNAVHQANADARLGRPGEERTRVPFFTKALTTVIGDGHDIVYDKRATVAVDYECELTIVIGRPGKDIPPERVHEHLFGYTIANDISARDLQIGHDQYFRGKSLDGFCPLGPWIATTRSVPNAKLLRIRQWVNGELRQQGVFGDMLWQVDHIVSELSQGMTLESGDLILTGTVPEVGFEKMPQIWLLHGDELVAEIDGIGRLRNTIKLGGIARAPM